MKDEAATLETVLIMAALIAPVRTARCADREFQGAYSPKVVCEVANALALARLICNRAREMKEPR